MDKSPFCLPIRINLDHYDYLLWVIIATHVCSVFLSLYYFPLNIGLIVTISIFISFRYYWDCRLLPGRFLALFADLDGCWFLLRYDLSKYRVTLDTISLIGPVMLLRFTQCGSPRYWLTRRSNQYDAHWHRARVFQQFYLSGQC